MILYGAGGHAKNIYDSLRSQGVVLRGIFDDDPEKKIFFGVEISTPYSPGLFLNEPMIISIGNNQIRRRIAQTTAHRFGTIVHHNAFCCRTAALGEGSVVMALAAVQSDVRIGRHGIINTAAVVEHDCMIDDFVHIGPGSVICGNVQIGQGTFIGANAVVLPGTKVGENVLVGAGSVILKNIPDGAKVAGNPARLI